MGIEIEGLEFQIETDVGESTRSLDKLVSSLSRLKTATKGGTGLVALTRQLGKLNESASSLNNENTDKLQRIANVLQSFSLISNAKISASLPKRLSEISEATSKLHESDALKLLDLSESLNALDQAGSAKVSANLPKRLSDIANSTHQITDEDNVRLLDLSTALREVGETSDVKISSVLPKRLQEINNSISGLTKSDIRRVQELAQSIKAFEGAGNVRISNTIAERIRDIGAAVREVSDAEVARLKEFTSALKALDGVKNIRIPSIAKTTNKVSQQPWTNTTSANNVVTPQNSGVKEVTSSVQEVTKSTAEFKNLRSEIQRIAGMSPFGTLLTGLMSLKSRTQGVVQKFRDLAGSARKSINVFRNENGLVNKLINGFIRLGSSIGGASAKLTGSAFTTPLKALGNSVTGVAKKVAGLGTMFIRVAGYSAMFKVFSTVTEGFKVGLQNLYQYALLTGDGFANSMDRIATSMQYVKNSIAAAVSPLINALAPAIDFVTDKIVTLINYINQLLSRLSGSDSYTRAKKAATSWGESTSKAAGQAAKSVKDSTDKIKRYTLGFDELNILGEKKDATKPSTGTGGTGGATGDTTDYGSMFEKVPIDSGIKTFADRIRKAFEQSDWKGLGTLIGNKVNEIAKNVDWAGLGDKLGAGLNGAIQTLYYTLKTIDFKTLGSDIATFINHSIKKIDWSIAGRLLTRGITSALDFVLGTLGGLDWGEIGKSVGEFLRGAFDEATEWLQSYDWGKMGKSFYKNFKKVITGLDVGAIAESFFKLLGTAIGASVRFLWGVLTSVATDIKNYLIDKLKENSFNPLETLIHIIDDIDGWIFEHIVHPFMSGLTGNDHWYEDALNIGPDLIKGLFGGITSAIVGVGEWINEHLVQPIIKAVKDFFGIHSPSTVFAEIGKFLMEGLLGGLGGKIADVLAWFGELPGKIKEKLGDAKNWLVEKGQNAIEGIKAGWEKVKGSKLLSNVAKLPEEAKKKLSKIASTVKERGKNIVEGLKEGYEQSKESGLLSKIAKLPGEATDTLKSIASTVKERGKNIIEGLKEGYEQSKESGLLSKIGNLASNIKDKIKNVAADVKERGQNIADGLKSGYESVKGDTVISSVGKIAGDIKDKLKNVSTDVSGVGKSIASGIKGGFKDNKSTITDAISDLSDYIGNPDKSLYRGFKSAGKQLGHAVKAGINGVSIKTPHIYVKAYHTLGGVTNVPSFGVKWYAKGGILSGAQLFGMLGNNFLGGGEAGREAVLPLDRNTEWMDDIAERVNSLVNRNPGLNNESPDSEMYDLIVSTTSRQNDLLREQNGLLRQLLDKDLTAEITTDSVISAMSRKNRRDGKTVVTVGT